MNKLISLISLSATLLTASLLSSCDKMPENGKLDGMWQLLEVDYKKTGSADSIVNTKDKQIYWAVQFKLISIRNAPYTPIVEGLTEETMARFRHQGDSILIDEIYLHRRSEDVLVSSEETTLFRTFGIDGNKARFKIEKLSDDQLYLSSGYARLAFRKF